MGSILTVMETSNPVQPRIRHSNRKCSCKANENRILQVRQEIFHLEKSAGIGI